MDVREKTTNDKRLIDANVVLAKQFATGLSDASGNYCGNADVVFADDIENAPTVDAVPVVRCRDCKHWKPSGSKAGNSFSDMEYIGGCEFTKYCRRESDFCSYGERKEGGN